MVRQIVDIPNGDDRFQNLNDETTSFFLKNRIETFSIGAVSGPFVGLGAGGARAELDLAEKFGIRDVTLVDKYPVSIDGFEGNYIGQNMFDFLGQTQNKYGFVTMIGLDYVIEHRRNWQMAWNGLQRITIPNSIVVIFPQPIFDIPYDCFKVLCDDGCLITQRTE